MNKTNAMRLLEQAKIPYTLAQYEYDENDLAGVHAAAFLQIPAAQFFKTLALKGDKHGIFLCCVPTDKEVNLKRAASARGEKSVEMLHVKDLLPCVGYQRGACTPIGTKKRFDVFFDRSVQTWEIIYLSAGCRGMALAVSPEKLLTYLGAHTCALCEGIDFP